MSGFFVSTAWSCVYLQNFATEFESSKVNLPKYFETYKNRCFSTYPDFVSSPLQCIQFFFSKTLFDFKKSISGLIELKFSGKTPDEVRYAPIYFWGVYF